MTIINRNYWYYQEIKKQSIYGRINHIFIETYDSKKNQFRLEEEKDKKYVEKHKEKLKEIKGKSINSKE